LKYQKEKLMDWLLLGWLFVMALGWAMVLWLELVKKWYWDQDLLQDLDQPLELEKDFRLLDLSKDSAQEKLLPLPNPKLPREKAQVREIELG
jgi:hypothetical protein